MHFWSNYRFDLGPKSLKKSNPLVGYTDSDSDEQKENDESFEDAEEEFQDAFDTPQLLVQYFFAS